MNDRLKQVLARPEVLMMGPLSSPVSGHTFPIYTAAKKIYTYPDTLHVLGEELGALVQSVGGRKVVGGETVGIVLATAISMAAGIPMCYVRKEPRASPRFGVEGVILPGEEVVLVDDSMVSGKTKLMFMKNIEEAGAKVTDIVVLLDVPRVSGGVDRRAIQERGIRYHHLLLWEDWFTALHDYSYLSDALYEVALDCARNIDSWQGSTPEAKGKWTWFERVRDAQAGRFI